MSARNFLTTGKKIVAIGRNFSEHAKELGNAVPKAPFFFLKPTSSYVANGGTVEIPTGCEVHHEVELAVVIGKDGRDYKAAEAMDYVAGYALAIDMTARNLQTEAKNKGLPWSASKGFDTFTPISDFIPKERIADTSNVDLWLKVNDAFRQNGNTKDMIFGIPMLLSYVSSIMKLEVGDVILTGTPKGVGPIQAGDVIQAGLKVGGSSDDLLTVKYNVANRNGLFQA
ncbi:hypothetical protein BDB00DRAFT_840959 [Zychaea mexicana]|uniref:uncharacterized protein n=1 Tax=Zychaea mexicana TaxID=64656 RepID=UPI0022FE0592|nr:uncharacterized protein BDB00DRAFT_840959 [Zychaea mexicana]KAI9489841.1 hypothetical protein BDB00DRAFT_840959 [Zychaea mexicana]